jgi:hypothetical protein
VASPWLSAAVDLEPAGVEGLESVDAAKQRALARAALADDDDDLAAGDVEVDPLEHLVDSEALAQGFDADDRPGVAASPNFGDHRDISARPA